MVRCASVRRWRAFHTSHGPPHELTPRILAASVAVIRVESAYNAGAVSSAGAVGLMQLLPETARGIAVRTGGDGFVDSDLLDLAPGTDRATIQQAALRTGQAVQRAMQRNG